MPLDQLALLDAFADLPDPTRLPAFALRLLRRTPEVAAVVAPRLGEPAARRLAGVDAVDLSLLDDADLGVAVLAALALLDGTKTDPTHGARVVPPGTEARLARLEGRARGDAQWWVPAARCHALVSPERERANRVALSRQDLPADLLGELDPVQVAVLAAGERVLPALHVDWVRKLSGHVAEALVLDLRQVGGWFWPLLGSLDADRLVRALHAAASARRLIPGSRGLGAAYLQALGASPDPFRAESQDIDRLVAALAQESTRMRAT